MAFWEERAWLGACLWSSLLDWASQPQDTIMGVTQEHSPCPLPPYYEEMHLWTLPGTGRGSLPRQTENHPPRKALIKALPFHLHPGPAFPEAAGCQVYSSRGGHTGPHTEPHVVPLVHTLFHTCWGLTSAFWF